jgi:hypothetical protein
MARTRINFESLSEIDKERLRLLLEDQLTALKVALEATNKELDDLTNPKRAKKAKKAKKSKKAKKAKKARKAKS